MAFGFTCNRKRGKEIMKKLSIFGVVALLLLGLSASALAADIKVSGKWHWILSPADYAAYKKGKCPAS